MEGKRRTDALDGLFGSDGLKDTPAARPARKPAPKAKEPVKTEEPKGTAPAKEKDIALSKTAPSKTTPSKTKTTPAPAPAKAKDTDPTAKAIEARKEYDRKTKGTGAILRKAVSIILGAATAGLVGLDYAHKANVMRDLMAQADYNAQLAELQREAIEAMHQGALGLLDVGNPIIDNGNIMGNYFPEFNGKYNAFAEANPEIADKINDSLNSYLDNPDIMNEYAQSRGFEDFEAFIGWGQANFGHMFNADGTIAADTTMRQLDQYYMVGQDVYNYLGQLAIQDNADEILLAGVKAEDLMGIDIIPQPITDEAGNVISNVWTTQISPDALQSNNFDVDPSFIVGAAAVTAIAGIGMYCISDKVISYFNKGTDAAATKDSGISK